MMNKEEILDCLENDEFDMDWNHEEGLAFRETVKNLISDSNWIPVSERLPEEHETMFAKFKDTNKWKTGMFTTSSDEVIVTAELEDGKRITTTSKTHDGEWWCEKKEIVKKKVIAWLPIPEPYKG